MKRKVKDPRYHSAEVYNHVKKSKKRKPTHKYFESEAVPYQLWYLAIALAGVMTAFLAIVLHR